MSKKSQIQKIIDAYIHRNGNREITGNILNGVLNAMLNAGVIDIKVDSQIIPKDEDGNVNLPPIATPAYVDGKVADETQRAEGAEGALRSSIASEVSRAKAKEAALQRDIDAEVQRATSKEASLQQSITDETQRAKAKETELQNGINAEKQRAEAKEAQLGNKIDGEKARAQQAESTLSTDISNERQRAQGAEFDLSARIDAIVQGRNVRDIVANYDELLAYDTSTLGDNDIIMVLLDSTKSGHTTYYKWHTNTQSWEFIGGLAFTYTKTEIDEKFAALHIVLPSINEQSSQETLAQVDTMVRGAGADASFKMPIDGIGNVDVTFVKSNPAHLYLGVFADDKSILFTINRTISTPRVYSCEIVEKVFAGVSDIEELQTEIDQMKEGLAEVDGEMLVFYDYSGASVQEETLVIS